MTEERWVPVPGFEGHYEVSNLGRVLSLKRGKRRFLAGSPNSFGYPHVILCLEGARHHRMIHSLVMEAFVGPLPDGMEVRHLDGDPANNRLDNLTYGSRSENMQDKLRHGTNHEVAKTHCPQGHEYDAENTARNRHGHRRCRACHRERMRAYRKDKTMNAHEAAHAKIEFLTTAAPTAA